MPYVFGFLLMYGCLLMGVPRSKQLVDELRTWIVACRISQWLCIAVLLWGTISVLVGRSEFQSTPQPWWVPALFMCLSCFAILLSPWFSASVRIAKYVRTTPDLRAELRALATSELTFLQRQSVCVRMALVLCFPLSRPMHLGAKLRDSLNQVREERIHDDA